MKALKYLTVLLAIPLILGACIPADLHSTQTPSGEAEMVISSFHSLYPLALEKAKAWNANAALTTADCPFWPKTSAQDPFCLFTFHSPSLPGKSLFLKIKETQSGYSFAEDQLDNNNQEQQFPTSAMDYEEILDSRVALNLILEQGGYEFIQSNPGMSWPAILILEHEGRYPDNAYIWRVNFINKQDMNQANYTLDALTGEPIGD